MASTVKVGLSGVGPSSSWHLPDALRDLAIPAPALITQATDCHDKNTPCIARRGSKVDY
ncbi:hypothetical protein GCM10010349_78470 [Streptomyces flavofungini]|nr:hypothetical protein GCM10010349_78470 [Streptomyces flavofungini]